MTNENLSGRLREGGLRTNVEWAETEVRAKDGAVLQVRVAGVVGVVRAEILLTHGLGEHAGRYGHVARALGQRGFQVTAYDLRGHGRSSGRRGDVLRYGELLDDLHGVRATLGSPGAPVFLFGHSLGGQLTLRYLQRDRPEVAGAIVASPWLRLAFAPPRWTLTLARAALRWAPGWRFPTGANLEKLTRDPAHVLALPEAHLMSHRISARMFFAVVAEGERALAERARIGVPLLLLHGDADPVTHWRSTEAFARECGPAETTLKIYPGVRHETHNDLGREQVLRDVGDWIEARLG